MFPYLIQPFLVTAVLFLIISIRVGLHVLQGSLKVPFHLNALAVVCLLPLCLVILQQAGTIGFRRCTP